MSSQMARLRTTADMAMKAAGAHPFGLTDGSGRPGILERYG